MARLRAVHPVLPVRDVERAIRFYVDRLGFALAFRDPSDPNGYAGVSRDDIELHLQWHAEEDFAGLEAGTIMLRVLVDDPDGLFAECRDRGVFHARTQLVDTPWGTREFAFYDLDGHGLTFYCDRS